MRQVPSGLIDEQYGMRSRRDSGGDLGQVQRHRLGVAARQDQGRPLAVLGTNGAEDVGGGGALIPRCRGAGTTPGPASGEFVLLPDPGLIAKPDLYIGRIDTFLACDVVQEGGKTFLKWSTAPAAWAW